MVYVRRMVRRCGSTDLVVWTDAAATTLVRQIIDALDGSMRPIGLGGPGSQRVSELAKALDCPCHDDFRKLAVDRPAPFVLVSAARGVNARHAADALDRGATIFALEPLFHGFDALATLAAPTRGTHATGGRVTTPGTFLRCPGWHFAADPTQVLKTPRFIQFTNVGPRCHRSLFARFYEAWQVVLRLGQLPHSVDASLTGPVASLPAYLDAITGHMAAHARMENGTSSVVVASDCVGRPARTLTLTGDEAHLVVTDVDYELSDAEGNRLDHHRGDEAVADFAALVARDLLQWAERDRPATVVEPAAELVLACCQASLLSARTGQVESPATILSMQHRSSPA